MTSPSAPLNNGTATTLSGPPPPRRHGWRFGSLLALTWVLAVAEVLLFTQHRKLFGPEVSPLVFYLTSLALTLAGLACAYHAPPPPTGTLPSRRFTIGALLGVGLLGLVAGVLQQGPMLAQLPDPATRSDVIPILQHYVMRFRSGEVVYKYILFGPPFNYPLFPNHLPMQWLPYVLADQAQVDYRWWALLTLSIVGFGAYLLTLAARRTSWWSLLLLAPLPALLFYQLLNYEPWLYADVAEPTIITYYCLLAAAVLTRSPWLQATALVACLLSRYSVVLWVPLYGLMLWREEGWRHAGLVAVLVAAGIGGIYVGPFLSKDWTIFTHALREYKIATVGEWTRTTHLLKGLGFAGWYVKHTSGDVIDKIAGLQRLSLISKITRRVSICTGNSTHFNWVGC